MPIEIERKFLVISDAWKDQAEGTQISQGYLSFDPERTVRVRLAGDNAFLTIKGISRGISRHEFEYRIPKADAEKLLLLCLPTIIDKTRYVIDFKNRQWEVDEFHGHNKGLVLAEVELVNEKEAVECPPWVGREVSDDQRYFNASLARLPFCQWSGGKQEL